MKPKVEKLLLERLRVAKACLTQITCFDTYPTKYLLMGLLSSKQAMDAAEGLLY